MSKNLLYLLLISASFALYFIAIKPLYTGAGGVMQPEKGIKDLRTLNSQYDDTLSRADALMNQAESMHAQYSRVTEEDKAKMAVMVPDSIDKVRLLSETLGIAMDAGFALNDLSYAESGGVLGGKGGISLSFSVKTTYPRFKVLMNNFEKSMRLFSIESVSFTAPEKETDLTTYQVKLQTYYLK
jgi:hypothetical protein